MASIAFALLVLASTGLSKQISTVVTPCPEAPSPWAFAPPVTVTAQHQQVSTCAPTTTCLKGHCSTSYPLATFAFVSTELPYFFNGKSASNTLVTKTEQVVVVSREVNKITKVVTVPTVVMSHGRPTRTSTTTTATGLVRKEWAAPYSSLGALAFPDGHSVGICQPCATEQVLDVTECVRMGGATKCFQFHETRVPVSEVKTTMTAACHTTSAVTAAGTYVFHFPQTAPASTITIPARTWSHIDQGKTVTKTVTRNITTVLARTWDAAVTRSCHGPTVFEIDITVTKTLLFTIPPFTLPTSSPTTISVPTTWDDWHFDPSSSRTSTTSHRAPTSAGAGWRASTHRSFTTSTGALASQASTSTPGITLSTTSIAITTTSTTSSSPPLLSTTSTSAAGLAPTCNGIVPTSPGKSQSEIVNAINQWLSEIKYVNNFLETAGFLNSTDLIQPTVQQVFDIASDEPCQFQTLQNAAQDSTAVANDPTFQCAVADLKRVFGADVLGNLQAIIAEPTFQTLGAKANLINQVRCCNVLPDVSILFRNVLTIYPGQQPQPLSESAPFPSTCQSVRCAMVPGASTCGRWP